MSDLKLMCTKLKPYKCQKCGHEMLFFYTSNGVLIDYKQLFEKDRMTVQQLIDYLQYKKVMYFKCITCNKLYIIDWTKHFPVPLLDISCLKDFGIHTE